MYTVNVGEADPRFGNMLLEQFGGANSKLAAALQYTIQGLNCDDMARKDLLLDIGTEELSHLEIIGTLARMHLKPMKAKKAREAAEADPLIAIAGGGGAVRWDRSRGCERGMPHRQQQPHLLPEVGTPPARVQNENPTGHPVVGPAPARPESFVGVRGNARSSASHSYHPVASNG
jgi:hypothetical protein